VHDSYCRSLHDPDIPVSQASLARADRRAIEQVISSLLDNTIQHADVGGRLSGRFYRVDASRSRDLGGTGLGRAIVRHLAYPMGGEVQVESEPGRGSRYHFSLPRN